jgi:hypothetical protein
MRTEVKSAGQKQPLTATIFERMTVRDSTFIIPDVFLGVDDSVEEDEDSDEREG